MKARDRRGPKTRRKKMSQLITPSELEGFSEQELQAMLCRIRGDLARSGQPGEECPHALASLRNIEDALRRKRLKRLAPTF
jgi:hypothetical protein